MPRDGRGTTSLPRAYARPSATYSATTIKTWMPGTSLDNPGTTKKKGPGKTGASNLGKSQWSNQRE
jgi:hypothetical protein